MPLDSPVLLNITNGSDIETIKNKMPYAVGYVADILHSIQHRFAYFHLTAFVLTVLQIGVFYSQIGLSLLDCKIVTRRKYSLTRPNRKLGPPGLLYNGIGQSFSDSLNNCISLNFIVPFTNKQI